MDGIGLSMGWVGSSLGLTCNQLDRTGWTENGLAADRTFRSSSTEGVIVWAGRSQLGDFGSQFSSTTTFQNPKQFSQENIQNNLLKRKSQKNLLKIQTKNPRSMRLKQSQNPEQSLLKKKNKEIAIQTKNPRSMRLKRKKELYLSRGGKDRRIEAQ